MDITLDPKSISSFLGFAAIVIGLAAYLPQIRHLLVLRCAAGISIRAYALWLAAAVLLLVHAVIIRDPVFIVLQAVGTALDAAVLFFAVKYRAGACRLHAGVYRA